MPTDFLTLLKTLAAGGVDFVIVGGLAAHLYGGSRVTHDADIVPRLDDDNWRRLIDQIWAAGGRPRIPESKAAIRRVENVRRWLKEKAMLALSFRSEGGLCEVDLLVSESERFEGLKRRATVVEIEDVRFYVAGIDDLIAMKQAAGRPRDLFDLEELQRIKSRLGQRPE